MNFFLSSIECMQLLCNSQNMPSMMTRPFDYLMIMPLIYECNHMQLIQPNFEPLNNKLMVIHTFRLWTDDTLAKLPDMCHRQCAEHVVYFQSENRTTNNVQLKWISHNSKRLWRYFFFLLRCVASVFVFSVCLWSPSEMQICWSHFILILFLFVAWGFSHFFRSMWYSAITSSLRNLSTNVMTLIALPAYELLIFINNA